MSSLNMKPPRASGQMNEEWARSERARNETIATMTRGQALDGDAQQRQRDQMLNQGVSGAPQSASGSASGSAGSGSRFGMHNPTPDIMGALSDAYHWIAD